jgi:hypothetical protein
MPYPNPAYRFLITDRDLSESNLVACYDPESAEGPLRQRNGTWYWNGRYTSEFMVDADISLSRCRAISFITHRRDHCRLFPGRCPDGGRVVWSTGAQTLAYVMGRNLTGVRHCFVHKSNAGAYEPGAMVSETLGYLLGELAPKEPNGPIKSTRRSQAIMNGALLLFGAGQFDDAQEVVRTLASWEVAETALEARAKAYLKLRDFSLRRASAPRNR